MEIIKLKEIIEKQRKGFENYPRYMIGEHILEIAEREPSNLKLFERDLQINEMNLEAIEKHFKAYSDKNHSRSKCFCITPKVAEDLIREFYGLTVFDGESDSGYIDVLSFL